MDPRLRDQRRYLAALAAAAAGEPIVHRCQLAALVRERALAASSDDPLACRIASGDLFELARAAWLDRLLAHARVAAALDDPWTAQAMAIELDATLAATGHQGWAEALQAGSARAQIWHERGAQARASASTLASAAVTAAWDRRPTAQAEARAAAAAAWRAWTEVEPALAGGERDRPAAIAGALALPRHAMRLPWRGDGLRALVALIANAGLPDATPLVAPVPDAGATLAAMEAAAARWRDGLARVTPGPLVGGEPELADVIAPYAGLTALPAGDPVTAALVAAARALVEHARGADTPQGALAAWTETGLLADFAAAPVRATARATLARAAIWPDPILVDGARALLADLSGIRTHTLVDLVSMHHGACAAAEAAWSRALGPGLLAPIEATAIAGYDPAGQASIAAAWRVAAALAGVGDGLTELPAVATVLDLIATRDQRPEDLGAYAGELGHTTVGEVRAWLGVAGIPGRSVAELVAALAARWGTPPAAALRPVRRWDTALDLDRLDQPAPRPPVPGRSARVGP